MLNLYIDLIKLIIYSYVVQILYALCRSLDINGKALDEVISFESQYLLTFSSRFLSLPYYKLSILFSFLSSVYREKEVFYKIYIKLIDEDI